MISVYAGLLDDESVACLELFVEDALDVEDSFVSKEDAEDDAPVDEPGEPASGSGGPAADVAGEPASSSGGPAADVGPPHNPWAELSAEQRGLTFWSLDSGKQLGAIHQLGPDQLKMTCQRRHGPGKCVCWLGRVSDYEKATKDLVQWLVHGGSKPEHADAAKALKLSYGMKLRS